MAQERLHFPLPNSQSFIALWTLVQGIRTASPPARNQTAPAPRHQRQQTAGKNRSDSWASFHPRHYEILAVRTEKVNGPSFNR